MNFIQTLDPTVIWLIFVGLILGIGVFVITSD